MQAQETSTQALPPSGAPDPSSSNTPIDEAMTELTVAERKVYDDARASDEAAAKPAEVAAPVVETPAAAAAVATPAVEPVVAAGYEGPIVPALLDTAAAAPDFAAQLKAIEEARAALDAKYDDGTMELADFRKQDRALTASETQVISQQAEYTTLAKSQAAFNAAAQQEATRGWETTYRAFLAQPESKAITQDALRFNAFQAAIHQVEQSYEDGKRGVPAHSQLLIEARNLFNTTFGITAVPNDATPPVRRAPSLGEVPVTIGAAPVAGADGTKSSVDSLYDLDIDRLEDTLAHMDAGKVDELLRQTPGSDYRGNVIA